MVSLCSWAKPFPFSLLFRFDQSFLFLLQCGVVFFFCGFFVFFVFFHFFPPFFVPFRFFKPKKPAVTEEGTEDCEGIGREMERVAERMGGTTKWPYNDSDCLDAEAW